MSILKDRIQLEIQEAELNTQKTLSGFPRTLVWLLVTCVIALLPAYYIAKNVSYKIWLSRYQQGALQAKPSFTNPQSPKISPVTVTTLGNNQFAALVQIKNANLDLSLDQVPYNFIFFNSQKQQISQYSGKLYLLPNQTKYVTVPTFNATEPVAFANFQLPDNLPWQRRANITTVNLLTSLPSTFQQTSPPAFVVQGDFTNQSPYDLEQVHLTFLLLDRNQNIIGISQRDEFTIAAFERRTYKQLWPNLVGSNVQNVKVYIDTDNLNPANISAPQVPAGPASDLSRPEQKQNY